MTKREENKLSMYKAVLRFLDNKAAKLASVPVLGSIIETYRGSIRDVETTNEAHQTVAKGAADQKKVHASVLIDDLMTVSGVLYTYAVRENDETLKALFKLTQSDLRHMRDTELLNRARTIHDRAEGLLSNLDEYTIDEARLQDLREKIDAYGDSLETREAVSGTQTAARVTLTDGFGVVDGVLYEQLDPMMEIFRTEDRNLYNEYKSVRVIKDI